eukprot:CAMPEP_0201579366 /NCGR_PEP_ID=MMETSP0190_2-20130828/26881_1 /ASSEMBLY_ACC=CAM_ASM_000263 /TAXON_ID=37353 /ORGANISM="Rosalina sp." /LENGTH=196 /DNA_ID=CAMNT_0048013711 /DNA_START=120 /DNA_END=710 /DNA_ORIENTATION=+
MQAQTEYKITVLGVGGVGKSALTIRLITGTYEANYDPTIEDSYRKQVQIDGKPALLDILDTAGQEEYAALQDQWIREGDGFLLVYSLTDDNSFESMLALRAKVCRILDVEGNQVPIVVCGNKSDLVDDRHPKLTRDYIEDSIKDWDCAEFETSAKEKVNIDEAFFQVVREIRRKQDKDESGGQQQSGKKGGFCILL